MIHVDATPRQATNAALGLTVAVPMLQIMSGTSLSIGLTIRPGGHILPHLSTRSAYRRRSLTSSRCAWTESRAVVYTTLGHNEPDVKSFAQIDRPAASRRGAFN